MSFILYYVLHIFICKVLFKNTSLIYFSAKVINHETKGIVNSQFKAEVKKMGGLL